MSSYLDPETEEFVQRYVGSFVAWDIIAYMARHQGVAVSAGLLADELGRKRQDVAQEIAKLEKERFLQRDESHRYTITQQSGLNQRMDKFLSAIADRQKRLVVLSLILNRTYSQ